MCNSGEKFIVVILFAIISLCLDECGVFMLSLAFCNDGSSIRFPSIAQWLVFPVEFEPRFPVRFSNISSLTEDQKEFN